MQTSHFDQLLAEIQERRAQQQENRLRLKHATFTFQTGLLQVERGIFDSTAQFLELIDSLTPLQEKDIIGANLHRRAS